MRSFSFCLVGLLLVGCDSTVAQTATSSGGGGASSATHSASSGVTTTSSTGSVGSAGTGGATTSTTTTTSTSTTTSSSSGAGGSGCVGLTLGPGDHPNSIMSSGTKRDYHVHAPPGYDPAKPTPLVFVFHGFTQSGAGIEDLSQMDPAADKHGFLAVYAEGLNNSWNAGACCGQSSAAKVPDVKFVADMLDQLEKDYCVDQKRVFSSGLSNGGMLSHRLACEMSDKIAAIGAVAGTLAIDNCAPPRPVPVLHIHGTADFVVDYQTGGISGGKGVPETIKTWVGIDGCTDAMPAQVYMKGDATCTEYSMCKPGTNVELCVIDQGGHQWPGGKSDGLGKFSTDLDSSETILTFFEAHPMP